MMKKISIFRYILAAAIILPAAMVSSCSDIAEEGFTVVEPGALTLSATVPQTEYQYQASEGTVIITSNTRWTASTDATWVTLAATSGSGDAELGFTLSANSEPAERTATITIASTETGVPPRTLSITQKYTTFGIDTYNFNFPQTGGTATFTLRATGDWAAFSDAEYLTITPSGGSGSAGGETVTVTIECAPNTSLAARTTTIVLTTSAGEDSEASRAEIAVMQEGGSFALSAVSTTIRAIDGSATFNVSSSNVGWTLAVTEGASWCHVTPVSGSGDAQITVTADDNDESAQRTAVVTVTAGTDTRSISIIQEAAPVNMQSTVVEVIYRDYTTVTVGYTADDGVDIRQRGVVYAPASQTSLPTLENASVQSEIQSSSEDSFSVRLYGLDNSTEYVARGYVTITYNSVSKTYYGSAASFTTKSDPTSGDNPVP